MMPPSPIAATVQGVVKFIPELPQHEAFLTSLGSSDRGDSGG